VRRKNSGRARLHSPRPAFFFHTNNGKGLKMRETNIILLSVCFFSLAKFNFFLMVCYGGEFLKMFFRHPACLPAQAKYLAYIFNAHKHWEKRGVVKNYSPFLFSANY